MLEDNRYKANNKKGILLLCDIAVIMCSSALGTIVI